MKDFCVLCDQVTTHDIVREIKTEEQNLGDAILTLIRDHRALLDEIEAPRTP